MSTLDDALDKLEKAIEKLESAQVSAVRDARSSGNGFDAESLAEAAETAQSENLSLLEERGQIADRLDKVIDRLNGMLEKDA